MKPIKFKGQNTTFAENQKPYMPLPAYKEDDGTITHCHKLNLYERIRILLTGRLWISVLTFNEPPQPILPAVFKPFKN